MRDTQVTRGVGELSVVGREPLGTRRLAPAAPQAKRRTTMALDALTGNEKEIG
jgi:hypothetical protein